MHEGRGSLQFSLEHYGSFGGRIRERKISPSCFSNHGNLSHSRYAHHWQYGTIEDISSRRGKRTSLFLLLDVVNEKAGLIGRNVSQSSR